MIKRKTSAILACNLLLTEILFSGLLFVGCKSTPAVTTPVSGMLPEKVWRDKLAIENQQSLKTLYGPEWQYNRKDKTQRPSLGLALSGGGIRSAMFSIGVMQGLHEMGILSNVDVLSSVSGGGYAASWLYFQSLCNNFNFQQLFDNNQKYQKYLVNHGELVSHAAADSWWFRWPEYIANGGEVVLTQPFNAFYNGLFGMHANFSPMQGIYQTGIDRVFHVVPRNDGFRSVLDWRIFYDLSCGLNPPVASRIEHFTPGSLNQKLPFPIINTTAHIEDASTVEASLLKNSVFEFTPLHCGNDYFGYQTNDFPFDYNTMIAVSGAAVDSKALREPNVRLAASAFNVDLGRFIDNPNIGGTQRFFRKLLPLPLYPFAGHYQKDFNGDRIYLADGGHSENLGAYSLARRLCSHIIIVDAEYDPSFTFEGYSILKKALRSEMNVDFSVEEIDNALLRHNFSGKNPVMLGTISSFPLKDESGNITNVNLKVIYIKLSLDPTKLNGPGGYGSGPYGPDIQQFRREHTDFPQRTTEDQSYSPEQVLAYRELGNYIVTHYFPRIKDAELRKAIGLAELPER